MTTYTLRVTGIRGTYRADMLAVIIAAAEYCGAQVGGNWDDLGVTATPAARRRIAAAITAVEPKARVTWERVK